MRRISDRFLIALFAVGIALPGLGTLWRQDPGVLAAESRRPAPRPRVSARAQDWKRFPAAFEAFVCDRLAFRDLLIRYDSRWKVRLFQLSPVPTVTIGRNGWLYLNEAAFYATATGKPFGAPAPAPDMQTAIWRDELRRRRDWLSHQGIEYVLVPIPEKHAIYPEFLPSPQGPTPTAAEQLIDQLSNEPGMTAVDLRPALAAAKPRHSVYYRNDTHWNADGAYVGYRELARVLGQLFPQLQPVDPSAMTRTRSLQVGDLARMIGDPSRAEGVELLTPGTLRAKRLPESVGLNPRLTSAIGFEPQVWGCDNPALPRAVVFHDSFARQVIFPTIAEHFDRVAFAPSDGMDAAVVRRFQPHVVIQLLCERKINVLHPLPFKAD
jgi:hypothetical protein